MIEFVSLSSGMREVMSVVERVAATDANVLITGESGAGKDAVAFEIHRRSHRSARPFVEIDCASLPTDLLEAELFGFERGAFTGAMEAKPGRIEAADTGTLVLDEIAHLSIEAQAKLLRVIERREFERLGGKAIRSIDSRLIALTNVDLESAVRRRAFRDDLFFRLNVIRIHVPPLRERRSDVGELAQRFVQAFAAKHGREVASLSNDALRAIARYDFPGNVRELSSMIERAVIVARGSVLGRDDLPPAVAMIDQPGGLKGRRRTLSEVEDEYITETLQAANGNKTEAAALLGISRKNLYERLARIEKRNR